MSTQEASATGTVYAPETASIGSIGVVSVLCNTAKLNEKFGISYTYITGGAWKAAGNGDTPLTDEERKYFQELITALHTLFKADVARDSAECGLSELASGNMCSELEAGKEAQARAVMLAGIQNAHQQPVAVTPGTEPTLSNPLLADAERRAKTVC